MNKIEFELRAILACLQDGKGIASAQAKAQEAADALDARGAFPESSTDAEYSPVFQRYDGPIHHGPQAPLAAQSRQPSPPPPANGQGGGKLPGGQVVNAGGPRSVGQSRTVNMTGGNQQPQGRSTAGNRGGASQGRGTTPPVVVQVGQGKPVL